MDIYWKHGRHEQVFEIVEASFLSQRRQLRYNVHCKGKGEQIEHVNAERQLKRNNCRMMQFAVLGNGKETRTVGWDNSLKNCSILS